MKRITMILLIPLTTFWACNEDPAVPNEEELITTLKLYLSETGGGSTAEFVFTDLDGDGGNPPVITGASLKANTQYTATLTLLNEAETPAEDITMEVAAEAEDHQFFYQVSGADMTISYDDQDANGQPIGIEVAVQTGGTGTGTLTITLRHQPDKSAAGVSNGEIGLAGGETDIEVDFSIEIL